MATQEVFAVLQSRVVLAAFNINDGSEVAPDIRVSSYLPVNMTLGNLGAAC